MMKTCDHPAITHHLDGLKNRIMDYEMLNDIIHAYVYPLVI